MSEAISAYSVEERVIQGETVWVAIRARGAEWSWLTPTEAARLGQQWVDKYGRRETATGAAASNDDVTVLDVRADMIAAE
jgi:hypothetical protein